MSEVVRIAPLGREPGLIAYECPECVYVTSVLCTSDEKILRGPKVRAGVGVYAVAMMVCLTLI